MTDRRAFLKTGAAAGALALTVPALTRAEALAQRISPTREPAAMDPATKELLVEALNAAKIGGASFADARIGRYRTTSSSHARSRSSTSWTPTPSASASACS